MEVGKTALMNNKNYYFIHLIEQIKIIKPDFFNKFSSIGNLLNTACQTNNFENIKIILNIIKENKKDSNVTAAFAKAAKNNSNEICKYFIDDKYFSIDYQAFLNQSQVGLFNIEIYSMILNNMNPEIKESFLFDSLYFAIQKNNKNLVEFLLSKNVPSENSLICATKEGLLDIVDIILKHNSDPSFINKKSNDGTALFIATDKNNLEIVKRLLSVPGIDPNLYGNKDQTPLICSIVNCNYDIINEILNFYGDDIQSQTLQLDKAIKIILDIFRQKITFSTISNNNFDNVRTENQLAANEQKSKLLPILKRILQIKNIDLNTHASGYTLLSYACESNEIDIVKMLLETDRIDVNAYSQTSGNTPLMMAIINKNTEIAELLINDKRTNINARNYNDRTALTFAVESNLENIVSLLIKNDRFNAFESCLNYAFYISKGPISNLLISDKSINVNYKEKYNDNNKSLFAHDDDDDHYFDSYRNSSRDILDRIVYVTSLYNAVKNNDLNLVNMIIQHPTFDKVKSQLTSSIFESVKNNNLDIFKSLLNLIDNDVNFCNDKNTSLLRAAVYFSSDKIFDEIFNHKNFDAKKVNIPELFEYALLKGRSSYFLEKIYEYDKNNGNLIDLNKHDEDGIYLLECAIVSNHYDIVSFLLNSDKIDINQQIKLDNEHINEMAYGVFKITEETKFTSYLHLAVCNSENSNILTSLLNKKGININIEDGLGNTPLMHACLYENKDESVFAELFKFDDLDYLHKNKDGKDALALRGKDEIHPHDKNEYLKALIGSFDEEKEKTNRKNKDSKLHFLFGSTNQNDKKNSKQPEQNKNESIETKPSIQGITKIVDSKKTISSVHTLTNNFSKPLSSQKQKQKQEEQQNEQKGQQKKQKEQQEQSEEKEESTNLFKSSIRKISQLPKRSFEREIESAVNDNIEDASHEEVDENKKSLSAITTKQIRKLSLILSDSDDEELHSYPNDYQYELMRQKQMEFQYQQQQMQQQQWMQLMQMSYINQFHFNIQMQQIQESLQTKKKKRKSKSKK